MILTKNKFKTSVNIRLDLGDEWILEKYIPTPTHIESLKGLFEGFLNYGNRSHIIVGSYGSGKSMIGALVSNIVSKKVNQNAIDRLIEKFDNIDADDKSIVELFNKTSNNNRTYIPVIINGNQGRFRETVISSIYKALEPIDFNFKLPSIVDEIKTKIMLWKENYTETYLEFTKLLKEKNWNTSEFLIEVDDYDLEAIGWFKDVYPSLTAGANFTLSYNYNINEYLEYVLNNLAEKGYGLFLVYDEFGRYLQSLDKHESIEAMQDIQDIAELADRMESFNVLFITHRNLKQYFLTYGEELQNEYNRIQGRYRIYHTHSDPATFIRISSQVTEEYRKSWNGEYEFENQIIKYDLFPELNGREKKTIVVENSYPLHPVSLFVLPRLANAVAQNERTLFTFLESNEIGGLSRYYETEHTWYNPQNLFDYFEPALHDFMIDSLIGKAYFKYLKVKKKVGKSLSASNEIDLLKLITLWDIANLNNRQKLNKEFMAFALNWDLNKVNKIINKLENKRIIRYRLFDDNWEIFEGSSIDIKKKIEEVKDKGIQKSRKLELLTDSLDSRFAYPKRYNDENNMIRYATIYPVYASDINVNTISSVDNSSDMNIFYIIPDDKETEGVKEVLIDFSEKDERSIFVLPYHRMKNIDDYLSRLVAIDELLEDKYLLSDDPIIREELLKIQEDTLFIVEEEMEPITKFQKSYWYHAGEDLKVKSRISLSEDLSRIMGDIYDRTPNINNESFNRRMISKPQLKGAKEVVNAIIGIDCNTDELKGPSKLVYASVVKNNNIGALNEKEEITLLREDLMNIIRSGKGDFVSLLNIFINEPYGIRKPNIPILLTAILKNDWKNIMFYHKDGSYINDLDGEMLYERLMDKPENYSFSYQSIDDEYQKIVKLIEDNFAYYTEETDLSYHPAIRINRMLSKWFRNLPKISQKTNKLSEETVIFKQLIKKGEFEPDNVLETLYEMNLDHNSINSFKIECEEYASNHKNLIESTIFGLAKVNSYKELIDKVRRKSEVAKVDNKFNRIILKSSDDNWIDNLAFELVGVNREDWSDATDEVFIKSATSLIIIDNTTERKNEYYEVRIDNNTLAIPKIELSSKGETIYSNIKTDLELMSRKLPKDEIKSLLYMLLVNYYEENK